MKQDATFIRARLKTPRAAAIASILFSVRARSHPSDHKAIPKLRVVPAAAPHIPLRKVPPGNLCHAVGRAGSASGIILWIDTDNIFHLVGSLRGCLKSLIQGRSGLA
jgi:hypothetical protein